MKTLNRLIVLITFGLLMFIFGTNFVSADNATLDMKGSSIVFMYEWPLRETTLQITVSDGMLVKNPSDSKVELPNRRFTIAKVDDDGSRNNLFSYDTMDHLLSAYVTNDVNSNLYTSWVTGSAYRFIVYSYQAGNIVPVLDIGSRAVPEMVLQGDGSYAIIVSNMDWTKDKVGRPMKEFVSADIYRWNGHVFKLFRSVPWGQRLKAVEG